MTVNELAYEINEKSDEYEIGKLQSIRKEIKGMKKRAVRTIFSQKSIQGDWAFHSGGRSEIQFNIAYELEGIRYGLAFSLETSRSLPDISVLLPKILKLNCLIREYPEFFSEFKMWNWQPNLIGRSKMYDVIEIDPELIKEGVFIFFGKISDDPANDVEEILETFDKLLWVYKTIETEIQAFVNQIHNHSPKTFVFNRKNRMLAKSANYTSIEKEINVDIRHSYLQEELVKELEVKYGEKNVSLENYFNGNKIDIAVKHDNNFYFYEIKTASSAKSCVRQAMGQLLEYAFGNGINNASNIFVAGEFNIDNETDTYLNYLRNEFKIPINYKKIDL